MKHTALILAVAWIGARAAKGQTVSFTDSNLPVFVVDTGGQAIPNDTKRSARLGVTDLGTGKRNPSGGPFNAYNGFIGIEMRGSSSQGFPKRSYAFETRDASGKALDVSLLGFPKENDWVLYGPYTDKSLVRNALMYRLSNAIGRYAPRTRFCELVLNGDYRGVYVLMEKVKRDKNRVDVAALPASVDSGDSLTGGYIVKIDKTDGEENGGWVSDYWADAAYRKTLLYQFHYPRPADITPAQDATIRAVVSAFERTMAGNGFADPQNGYPRILRTDTFVDYFLLQELARNVDAYRLSTFLCKDRDSRDGRLFMGPLWDLDLALGNADYYNGWKTEGWQLDFLTTDTDFRRNDGFLVPFWWSKLRFERLFQDRVRERWTALRQGPFRTEALLGMIDALADTLGEARERNFERWPVLGRYVWPNAFVAATYAEETDSLKHWLSDRARWMDSAVAAFGAGTGTPPASGGAAIENAYPNPFRTSMQVPFELPTEADVSIRVFDATGRRVRSCLLVAQAAGRSEWGWNGTNDRGLLCAPGVYLIRFETAECRKTAKVVFLP